MMETVELQGQWWIPGKKRSKSATGTLKYTPMRRGELNVFGNDLENGKFQEPVIYGDTTEGQVTLYDVVQDSSTWFGRSGQYAQKLSCDILIKGGHFPRNCRFKRADIHVKHLDEWARLGKYVPLSPAVRKLVPNAQSGSIFQKAPSVNATLPDGSEVTLGVGLGETFSGTKTSLRARHYLSIAFPTAKTVDKIIDDYARPLCNLITLATDEPSSLVELVVLERSGVPLSPKRFQVSVNVGISSSEHSRLTSPGTQIIRFQDFSFARQLATWFKLDQELRGIHGLISGLQSTVNMTVENRILNAVTAAEALHRATFANTRTKVDFKNKHTKIWLGQFPANEQNLIRSRLNGYINEPSLGDRLSGLTRKAGVAFEELVPDISQWMKIVKETRNALTHQEGRPKVALTVVQMYWLAESVAILVQMCLMVDLGIKPTEMKEMFGRSGRAPLVAGGLRAFI